MSKTLAQIRDYEEEILNLPTGDSYIDSTLQLDHIQQAYYETAYRYNWPEMFKRYANIIVANKDRYALQTNFRKFDYLFVRGYMYEPTSLQAVKYASNKYAVDKNSSDYILSERPTTASTAYTASNSETAGNNVVVELDTVTGLSDGEEIWINSSGTPEFTVIESVDTTNTTITISFKNNITSGNKLYLTRELNVFGYFLTVTDLSATGDVPITPNVTHLIIPYYAAFIYYSDKLEDDKAERYLKIYEKRLADAFLSHAQTSTGPVGEFSI